MGAGILRYKFNKCDHKKAHSNTLSAYINPAVLRPKLPPLTHDPQDPLNPL